jgi:hypothetical protein
MCVILNGGDRYWSRLFICLCVDFVHLHNHQSSVSKKYKGCTPGNMHSGNWIQSFSTASNKFAFTAELDVFAFIIKLAHAVRHSHIIHEPQLFQEENVCCEFYDM